MKQFDKVLLMTLLMYAFFASFIYASVEEEEITMEVGTTWDYSYFSDKDGFTNSYYWQVIGESVILASEVGIKTNIMAVKPGKCIVIETRKREKGYALAYECYYDYLKLTITVTGTDPTSMVMQHQLHLGIGQTHTLSPRLLPSGSTSTLTWYSSNTSVATVSNGKITAVAVGDATITCITANGLREDCEVTVSPTMVSNLSLNQDHLQMSIGDTYQFNTAIAPENATYKQVTWTSMNPDVVSIDSNGLMSCLSNGWSVILAQTVDGSNLTAGCFVQVGVSEGGDVNGDGALNVEDVTELIDRLINGVSGSNS